MLYAYLLIEYEEKLMLYADVFSFVRHTYLETTGRTLEQ